MAPYRTVPIFYFIFSYHFRLLQPFCFEILSGLKLLMEELMCRLSVSYALQTTEIDNLSSEDGSLSNDPKAYRRIQAEQSIDFSAPKEI